MERLARLLFIRGRNGCFEVAGSSMDEAVVCVELEGADGGLFARSRKAAYDESSAIALVSRKGSP